MEKSYVLSALVDNHPGVLSRISGLFTRRDYNIDSLTVAATEHINVSRMTISVTGEPSVVEQIEKQLAKQEDVRNVVFLSTDNAVIREYVLIKICCDISRRHEVISTGSIFRAKVIDVSEHSLMFELTGDSGKVDAFIELMKPFKILQVVRSGVSALPRGEGFKDEK